MDMEIPIYSRNSEDKILSVVSKSIYNIILELNVSAIIIVGYENLKIKNLNNIPILYTTSNINTIIEKLTFINIEKTDDDIKENINKIKSIDERNKSIFKSIIPIEYGLENIKDGIIIGILKSETSASIIIYNSDEDPIIKTLKNGIDRLDKHVLSSILKLTLDLAIIGREGKKIGTAFIIGDTENVLKHSHQMIINPYKSQELKDKDILRRENWESIMNFAQLDGVFLISSSGEIVAAGRYLDVDAHNLKIEKGLGSRHISSASITKETKAIAIIISESGGTVRLYMNGKEVLCINPYTTSIIFNKKIM